MDGLRDERDGSRASVGSGPAGLPLVGRGKLPAADEEIDSLVATAEEALAFADGHFPDAAADDAMRAAVVGGALSGLGVLFVVEVIGFAQLHGCASEQDGTRFLG